MTDDLNTHRVTPVVKALLVAVAVTVLLLGWFWWASTDRANDLDRKADALAESLDARAAVIDELAAGQATMREQLLANDIEPDIPAPSQTVREIIREAGATGATGRDGRDGITPACWFEASRCVGSVGPQGPAGADGQDGQDGANGADGQAGADSTTPGPQGPAGSDGRDGAPGPACPPEYEPRVMETGPYQGWIACAPTGDP